MKYIFWKFWVLSFVMVLFFTAKGHPQSQLQTYDVVIYGATLSGIAAAVNAAEEGMQVGLFEETSHIGGMVSAGMSNTDFKTFEALGGTYKEFMDRVTNHYSKVYGPDSKQVDACYHGAWYEPKVAKTVFGEMLSEYANLKVFPMYALVDAKVSEGKSGRKKLESVQFNAKESDRAITVKARVFIDATYEGDLLAKAGCRYELGRESRQTYGELYAGVKYYSKGRFLIGSTGEGDHKVQCYNFRICMTRDRQNYVAIEKPVNYQRDEFLPLLELMQAGKITELDNQIVKIRPIPNQKADFNDLMYSPVSLRLPGENYEWPEGDAQVRQKIFERHKTYSLGLLYFLQHDEAVPANIRKETLAWGLPKDEFQDSGNFPPMLYIREGRRLLGDFVLTEHDTQPQTGFIRARHNPDAIAICDYSLDSHGNAPPGNLHPLITEGVFNRWVQPYQIPYQVTVPAAVDGLLVSCAVSASHVAYSSLRMEPTWAAIGQAVGLAAAQSIKANREVRAIDIGRLQKRLHELGAMTIYLGDVGPASPYFADAQYFGTKGYFHQMPEYRDMPYIGRGGGKGMRGQHIHAYPYHDIHPEKMMDEELAKHWWKKAGLYDNPPKWDIKEMSRGGFLKKLKVYLENN